MARASVFELVRIGLEDLTTPVPVKANLILPAAKITVVPVIPRDGIRKSGNTSYVGQTTQKQHTTFSLESAGNYCELPFLLNSVLCAPTVVSADGMSEITWIPSSTSKNNTRRMTLEMGSAEGSAGAGSGYLHAISFSFEENNFSFSADGIAKVFQEGIVLSTGAATIMLEPASSDQTAFFVADTLADLDIPGARLKGCLGASFQIGENKTAIFTLDDSERSWTTTVEKFAEKTAEIKVIQNEEGGAMMTRLKENTVFWCRFRVRGREISEGKNLEFSLTFPAMISSTSRGDDQDAYSGTYSINVISLPDAFGTGAESYLKAVVKVPTAVYTQSITASTPPTGGNGVQISEDTISDPDEVPEP